MTVLKQVSFKLCQESVKGFPTCKAKRSGYIISSVPPSSLYDAETFARGFIFHSYLVSIHKRPKFFKNW